MLPAYHSAALKSWQSVMHQYLPRHMISLNFLINIIFWSLLVRITKCYDVHVPWLELSSNPANYLNMNIIPESFKVLDLPKLTKSMITLLWAHWTEWAKAKLSILAFIKAWESDLELSAMAETVETDRHLFQKKRAVVPYIDVGSDDEPSDDNLSDHTGNGNRARLSSSKHLCLYCLFVNITLAVHAESINSTVSKLGSLAISKPRSLAVSGSRNSAVSEMESPATAINDNDKQKFLYSLSTDASYTSLLSHVLPLPGTVSIFPPLHV